MYRLDIVTGRQERFAELADTLAGQAEGTTVRWHPSGTAALEAATDSATDLMVVDENLADFTALAFLRKLMAVNAMINTAVASSLTVEDFHETYEGLGVLMQLPPKPDRASAMDLIERLRALMP